MIICFILAITVHVQITEAYLPGSARFTDSCPQPNNLTAWQIAARRMNCSEYTEDNIRLKDIYHCLPSVFLDETVEFCGRNAAIAKGYCPVYDYTNNATVATSRSCKNLTTGCPEPPDPPYHSPHFYKYSECFNIDKTARCYNADPSCSKIKHSSLPPIATSSESSISWSASSEASTPGYKTTSTTNKSQDSSMPGGIIAVIVVSGVLVVLFVILFVILLIRYRKTTCKRARLDKKVEERIETYTYKDTASRSRDGVNPDTLEGLSLLKKSNDDSKNNAVNGCVVTFGSRDDVDPDTLEVQPFLEKREENDDNSNFGCGCKDDERKKTLEPENQSEEKGDDAKEKKGDDKEENTFNADIVKEPEVIYISEVTKSRNVGDTRHVQGDDAKEKKGEVTKSRNVGDTRYVQDQENDPIPGPIPMEDDILDYGSFYYDLCCEILDMNLLDHLKVLLQASADKNAPDGGIALLSYWNKKYEFYYNMLHLQQLLIQCGADELFSKCEKYAQGLNSTKLRYLSRTPTDNNRDILEIHTPHDINDAAVRKDMEKIRETIARRLRRDNYEIRLSALKEGCLIFIFSLPDGCIRNLISDSDMSSFWKLGIFKMETSSCIITPDSGIQMKPSRTLDQTGNPTKHRKNCSKTKKTNNEKTRRLMQGNVGSEPWIKGKILIHLVRKDVCTSSILKYNVHKFIQIFVKKMNKSFRHWGSLGLVHVYEKQATVEIKLRGTTTTTTTSLQKAWECVKYRELLPKEVLEEMEPNVVLGILKRKFPKYFKDFQESASRGNCRREKVENIFNHLKEMKGKKFKNVQNGIIEKCRNSEKRSTDDLRISADKADIVKRKISSERNDLVEEIDSTIINDTMEKLGLSEEKYIQSFYANSGKSRSERVDAFLDFVLANEDYLLPFDEILRKHEWYSR